jgi:hypothetical protein
MLPGAMINARLFIFAASFAAPLPSIGMTIGGPTCCGG